MSRPTDLVPGAHLSPCSDPACGCCEGVAVSTPTRIANRPGLETLTYRVGTHATFFDSMLARLSSLPWDAGSSPLMRLTTRSADDPQIALLDAWASVAHVLTFYQERIANEGYLRDVEVDKVLDFEAALLSYMRSEYADFMDQIDETGDYNDEVVATLKEAIEKFKATQTY